MFSRDNHAARIRIAPVLLICGLAFVFCAFSLFAQSGLNLEGKAVDPVKASTGKVAVLIFVRTDCPISNRYAPLLQKLNDEFAGKAKFWLVYPDKKTTPQHIAGHLQQFHYSISALRDPDHSLVKLAGAAITPESAVFDSQGRLVYHGRIDNLYEDPARARPAATTHELQNSIEAAIAGKTVPVAFVPAVGCYISDLE
jgi:thiol-disulfide isomerase/thioredoxin